MFRLALITLTATALQLPCDTSARADGFDALINIELAFRDSILDQPAPQSYQALIRDGETTITFVRDLPASIGKTDFLMNVDWTFSYRVSVQADDGITEVSVTPLDVKVTPRLRHVIQMPLESYHAEVWGSRLLAHEFDHVAVSLDPRPRAMLVYLCRRLPTIRFAMEGDAKPSEKRIREDINREIQRRQSAILDLLRANYVALDKVSQHGRSAIQERRDFFESLYTKSNLEAAEFPFCQEVEALLEAESYRKLRPRQVAADPATLSRR